MDSNDAPQQRDLHIGVLIISSAAVLILFCVNAVLSALPYIGRLGPISDVFYEVLALLVLGYVTGRTAINFKALPNLHIVVLGFFLMHAQTLILFLQYIMSPDEIMNMIRYGIPLTMFIIPLMLLGCGVARRK